MSEKSPMVSVIIPVYNVEKYLSKCLYTIENQTYKNYEVVLVDDGSTDNSGDMCDQYCYTHDNAKVIHQVNQGLSAARNAGVKIAKGELVTFIDSDDYVSLDYIEYLVRLIVKYNADISVAQELKTFEDIASVPINRNKKNDCCFKPGEALIEMCYTRRFKGVAWCKMYKKSLVEKYPFPVGKLYEDIATVHKMIGDSSRIACGDEIIYFYRQGNTSIMRSDFNKKQLDGMRAAENQLQYMKKNYPEAVNAAKYKCAARINNYMFMLFSPTRYNKRVFYYLQKEMKKYSSTVLRDRNVRVDFKVRMISILMGYNSMRLTYRLVSFLEKRKNRRKQKEIVGI